MLIVTVWRTQQGLEFVEDQVSVDVGCVVQVSKSDLIARGVALDLLQMAELVGPQYEAAEYEDLSGEEDLSLDRIVADDRRWIMVLGRAKVTSQASNEDHGIVVDLQTSHRSFCRSHSGTLNESTNVGVKTGGSRVGGPELCV